MRRCRRKKLPSTLLDALRLLENSAVLRGALGDAFIDAFLKLKLQEWQSYTSHLSDWERTNAIDC